MISYKLSSVGMLELSVLYCFTTTCDELKVRRIGGSTTTEGASNEIEAKQLARLLGVLKKVFMNCRGS